MCVYFGLFVVSIGPGSIYVFALLKGHGICDIFDSALFPNVSCLVSASPVVWDCSIKLVELGVIFYGDDHFEGYALFNFRDVYSEYAYAVHGGGVHDVKVVLGAIIPVWIWWRV